MKGSLRLLEVRVQHVGVLGERLVTLGPFVPGINVISGPNESGKSTVVRALRAALFQRHGSKHETIKSLQPRSNRKAAPRVEVEFELDGTRYLLEKQFLHGVSARLQSADGAVSLRDDEADQRLFALLGAREPGKKVVADDMGVWSLLWVNQDAFATSEPAEQMGPHVRGTLAESIGSIVGDVMGGEHGIPLRRAIEEAFASVWTPQAGRPTGKLLAAREAHEGLTAEVAELEKRVRQTEALGADLGRMEAELATLREEGARLADDLAACERAATAAEATERGHADAAARLAEAERAHAEARGARVAREKQRSDLAALEASARALGETHAPLAREAERRAVQAREAEYAEATARGERDRVQRSVFELGDAIARAKVREDLARAAEALAEARRLTARIEACAGERRGLPDEDALREMRELEAQRSIVAEHVRRHATRVTLHRPGSEPAETTVPRRELVALAELGSLTLEPPREGFLRAREAWREVRSTLAATLAAHGVASVGEARSIAERRRGFDEAAGTAREALRTLAPQGIAELAVEVERAEAARKAATEDFEAARESRKALDQHVQLVASVPVDAAALEGLEALAARVATLEAKEGDSPVRVTLRALAAVRVQVGDREIPRILSAGAEVKRPVTGLTTVTVGEQLAVEIDPGADVQARAASLGEARRALAEALGAHGVASLAEARAQARQRGEFEVERGRLERALKERAPKGVDALHEALQRRAKTAEALRQRLGEARRRDEALVAAEREARACPIAPATFETLDGLDRRALAAEQAALRLAARVVAADGLLAGLWSPPHDLLEDGAHAVGDARVELTLGEVAHEHDLPAANRDLERRLRACGVATLAAATEAHARWRELGAEVQELQRSLTRTAPQGIAALEAAVSSLEARATGPADEVSRAERESRFELERGRLDGLVGEVAQREAVATLARAASAEAAAAAAKAQRSLNDREVERDVQAKRLREDEGLIGDAALRAADERTGDALRVAAAAHDAALAARDEAMPDIRRRDLERARRAAEEHRRALEAKHLEVVRGRASLEATLPEGHYERLADRRVALDEAAAELARIERSARALRLLRETAEGAYTEAQRALMAPVYDQAMPLLRHVRPGTTFTLRNDTLEVESVNRRGAEEEFRELSGGAREQLALVVRIALAKVFAQQNRCLPLVLDDILGWTDDQRLKGVLNMLEDTAREMQVILLTCHPPRFRGIEGAAHFDVTKG